MVTRDFHIFLQRHNSTVNKKMNKQTKLRAKRTGEKTDKRVQGVWGRQRSDNRSSRTVAAEVLAKGVIGENPVVPILVSSPKAHSQVGTSQVVC